MQNRKFSMPAAFILVVIALFFILLYIPGLYSTLVSSIPEFPPTGESGNIPDGEVGGEDINQPLIITRDNAQSVISALVRPNEYYYETQSELVFPGGTKQYLRRKWQKNNWTRVDIMNSVNSVEMHIIYGGGDAFFWRPGDYDYYRTKAGEFTADTSQMIMIYEDILRLDATDITDAQYTMFEGAPCIYVEAMDKTLDYIERYWVSTENGLLLYGQTLSDGTVVYSVRALTIDISVQDESLFFLPGGQLAMDAS